MPASSADVRGAAEDLVVGDGDRLAHALGRRAERPRQPLQDHVARGRRRDFAAGLAADAVDDAEHAARGVEHRHVFVVRADAAGMRPRRRAAATGAGAVRTSATVVDARQPEEARDARRRALPRKTKCSQ